MIAVGFLSAKSNNAEGFVIGSRNIGLIPTLGSLAAGFRDGGGIVFWVGAGAIAAFGGLWVIAGVVVTMVFMACVGSSVRQRAKEKDYITIGQIIRDELGVTTEKVTSLIVVAFTTMMVALQLYVSGNLISSISPLGMKTAILCVIAIVAFYLLIGGYANVVFTDAIQFFLIISLIFIPFFVEIDLSPLLEAGNYLGYGASMNIALFLVGICYMLCSGDVWQRIFSAKNGRVIKTAFPLASVMLLIMSLSLLLVGMAAQSLLPEGTNWDNAFFIIFQEEVFPSYVLAFIAIVCIAITMSTLDTLSYLAASTFLKNILSNERTDTRDKYVKMTRLTLIVIMVAATLISFVIENAVKYMFDAMSMMYILSPIYLMAGLGWLRRHKRLDIFCAAATILSALLWGYMFAAQYFADLIMTFIPALVNTVLCLSAVTFIKFGKNNA